MNISGIEPATFQLVAQYPNQLLHCVSPTQLYLLVSVHLLCTSGSVRLQSKFFASAVSSHNKRRGGRRTRLVAGLSPWRVGCERRSVSVGYWRTEWHWERFVFEFYDRMTVHRNRFLVNQTNRCTEIQFFWFYYSVVVIPIKLDFSASVGFIHKEFVFECFSFLLLVSIHQCHILLQISIICVISETESVIK